jgi:hypothetical protein
MDEVKWFNKKPDTDVLYRDVDQLFRQCGWPFVIAENKIIPNGLFWSSLVGVVTHRSVEYSATPIQDRCTPDITQSTSYGAYNYETNMLMLGLMALSWSMVNMKKKTEDGHCRNPVHVTTKNKTIGCTIGSEFHKGLYDDCQSLLQDFIDTLKKSSPVTIRAPKEKK